MVLNYVVTTIDDSDRPVKELANDGAFKFLCLGSLSRPHESQVPCRCLCFWRWMAILESRAVHHVAPYAVFQPEVWTIPSRFQLAVAPQSGPVPGPFGGDFRLMTGEGPFPFDRQSSRLRRA